MATKKLLTYADAIAEVEMIIQNIEEEKYSIDELSDKIKRITFLISFCKEKLHATEDEVTNLLKKLE